MSPRCFAVIACGLALTACSPAPSSRAVLPPAPACTRGHAFVVVRHAEKVSKEKDAPLSELGRARAEELAKMLAKVGATRLLASNYQRTQQTLAPLAARLGLPVETRAAEKVDDLVAELRATPDGAVVVVASHSNVVPRIVRDLGDGSPLRGVSGDELADDDYARVYVVTVACGGRAVVVELSSDR